MRSSIFLLLTACWVTPVGAQLRLSDALARADAAAIANRAADAQGDVARAQRLVPLRGILPSVRAEAGYVRTTDPIGAFGTALRQRRVSPADFAPDRLNYPDVASNYTGALVLEVPIVNADAWMGRTAASRAADAVTAAGQWTHQSTRADVVRAFYGTALADARVRVLEAATRAAAGHVKQAQSALAAGFVTASDAMLASVKAAEFEAELASARGDASTARRGLAVLLGYTDGRLLDPSDALPSAAALRAFAAVDTTIATAPRADVQASQAGTAAAKADALRARALYLPRVNSFARYDWNDRARIFANDRNWTVGVMASWSPFSGASEIAESRATTARAAAAQAMQDGAVAAAGLDAARALTDLRVALERLAIAERSVVQATDAHRIVSRRYDGGLATVVELLDASAANTQTQVALDKARFDVIVALTARRLAIGADPGQLASLNSETPSRSSEESY
ncbi:MAG: TolC family protein [Gemmatimonadetes bacterium]|nr:TolC family protein [Gemmatimonadota bacterium]